MARIVAGRREVEPLKSFTSSTSPRCPMVARTLIVSANPCRRTGFASPGQTKETSSPASNRAGRSAAGPGSGETRTESCEVIAKEDVAAIAFSGNRNGWLPRLGTVTRIAEGLGRCGATPIVGVGLYVAGLLGALPIGPTALGECARSELAGGDTFGSINPVAPLCSELTSGLADGLDSVVRGESESLGRTSAEYSEPRVLSLGFSPEGAASSSPLEPARASEVGTGGVGVREVDSFARSGSVGDLASIATIDFGAARRRFPCGPRPTVSPTAKAITANKNGNPNTAT